MLVITLFNHSHNLGNGAGSVSIDDGNTVSYQVNHACPSFFYFCGPGSTIIIMVVAVLLDSYSPERASANTFSSFNTAVNTPFR